MNKKGGENRSDLQQQPEDYSLHVDSDHDSQLVTTDGNRRKVEASSSGILGQLNQAEMEWLLVAYAVDRLAIAFYFLAFAIMMMTYA